MKRRRARGDTAITVARYALVGSALTAAATLSVGVLESDPQPPSPTVECTVVLERLDRFIGSDQKRIDALITKGSDGVAPLDRELGAGACGIGPEELQKMLDAVPPAIGGR